MVDPESNPKLTAPKQSIFISFPNLLDSSSCTKAVESSFPRRKCGPELFLTTRSEPFYGPRGLSGTDADSGALSVQELAFTPAPGFTQHLEGTLT